MIQIPCEIALPQLWDAGATFTKNAWGYLNFLVGPNGSGKTLFADQLKQRCEQVQGLRTRYVSAERLTGLEKENTPWQHAQGVFFQGFDIGRAEQIRSYGVQAGYVADAFFILRDKADVRLRVQAILSTLFGRRIRFAEEGGFLRPKIQRVSGGGEYSLRESECHGLKEILTLLTTVYDDAQNCLIIDEPELHLHPQFQTFFLAEVRRLAGNPLEDATKKCFFLITHAPTILDVRTIDEIRNCLVFREGAPPVIFEPSNQGEENFLKRFLPRLNTHHKQFFFSSRPIFVEGYTDQQLFSLIEYTRGKMLGANGASFIDVGGKSEQEFFFRLTRRLGIQSHVISDLDVLTNGRLRDAVSEDPNCQRYMADNGLGANLMDGIATLVRSLDAVVAAAAASGNADVQELKTFLLSNADAHKKRYAVLAELLNHGERLRAALPEVHDFDFIEGRVSQLRNACACAGVHLHAAGELENTLASYAGNAFDVSDAAKQKAFETERDFILTPATKQQVEQRYAPLVPLLDAAVGEAEIDLKSHVSFAIAEVIGKIQLAFARGELVNLDSFSAAGTLEWPKYSRILDVLSLDYPQDRSSFVCRMRLRFAGFAQQFEITDGTQHAKFQLA